MGAKKGTKNNAKSDKRTAKKRAATTRRSATRRAKKPEARKRSSAKAARGTRTPKRTRSAKREGTKRVAGKASSRASKRESEVSRLRKEVGKLNDKNRMLREVIREYEPQPETPIVPTESLRVPKGAEVLARDEKGRPTAIAMDKYIGDEYDELDFGDDMGWDDLYDEFDDEDEDAYAEAT